MYDFFFLLKHNFSTDYQFNMQYSGGSKNISKGVGELRPKVCTFSAQESGDGGVEDSKMAKISLFKKNHSSKGGSCIPLHPLDPPLLYNENSSKITEALIHDYPKQHITCIDDCARIEAR